MQADVPVSVRLSEAEFEAAAFNAAVLEISMSEWIRRAIRLASAADAAALDEFADTRPLAMTARGELVAIEYLEEHGGEASASDVLDVLEEAGLSRRSAREVQRLSDRITVDGRGFSTSWKLVS